MLNKLEAAVVLPSPQKGCTLNQLLALKESTFQFPLRLYESRLKRAIAKADISGVWRCPGGTLPWAPAAWCSSPTSLTAVWQERTITAEFSKLVRRAQRQWEDYYGLWLSQILENTIVLIYLPRWLWKSQSTSSIGNNRLTLFWLW